MKNPRWVNESDESINDKSNTMNSLNDGLDKLNDSIENKQMLVSDNWELEDVRLTLQGFTIG